MEYMKANEASIRQLVRSNHTHKEVARKLCEAFPEVQRGFSERNVRLFCAENNIKRMGEEEADDIVRKCVEEVGPAYGRKMMFGYVTSKGLGLTKHQTRKALKRVNPVNHHRRCEDVVRRQNPIPYSALYHGQKLHCDQNEKLQGYGCTFIAFSDGCSGRIVSLFAMPKKNAVVAYSYFRKLLLEEGIWDMIRVDHGTEFALMLFVQQLLRDHRGNQDCEPYAQTQSRQNLRAERKWPELNQRVIYPIKEVLVAMENGMLINLYNPVVKFCVSFITINVAEVGAKHFVTSWNSHPLEDSNQRIPNLVATNQSRVKKIAEGLIPSVEEAVRLYENSGGALTTECFIGSDPLRGNDRLTRSREERFRRENPPFEIIFSHIVSSDCLLFQRAVLSFITITENLANTL